MRQSPLAEAPVALDPAALGALGMPDGAHLDKYRRGTVLVVGGSTTTPGGAILAGLAALRIGAGRLRIATAAEIAPAVAVAVPEAMVVGVPSSRRGLEPGDELAGAMTDVDALVVGPGLAADEPPVDLLTAIASGAPYDAVIVVDAMALAALDLLDDRLRAGLAGRTVLTPNRREAELLAGAARPTGPASRLAEAARRSGAVVTSFGEVHAPDGRSWHAGEAAGLGTSGSGDVLAGLVGGAAARGRDAVVAACWGTYAHVAAGRRLAASVGPLGYLARELVDAVPACLTFDPVNPRSNLMSDPTEPTDLVGDAASTADQTPAEPGAPSDNTSLLAVLQEYEDRGFTGHLSATDDGTIHCDACGADVDPSDVAIDESRRLEGASDPDDMMTASAVTCPACGRRATIVVAFGPISSAADQTVAAAFAATRAAG